MQSSNSNTLCKHSRSWPTFGSLMAGHVGSAYLSRAWSEMRMRGWLLNFICSKKTSRGVFITLIVKHFQFSGRHIGFLVVSNTLWKCPLVANSYSEKSHEGTPTNSKHFSKNSGLGVKFTPAILYRRVNIMIHGLYFYHWWLPDVATEFRWYLAFF